MLQGRSRQSSVAADAASQGYAGVDTGEHHLQVVPDTRRVGGYERFVKPGLDRFGGVVLSVLTLPILAALIPLIWVKLGRPAIFRQSRVGRFGEQFTVYKLRTMKPDRRENVLPFDGTDRRVNHKDPDDPRHVPFGRTLRRWSLDELPQFWNVALGQMSLVGPRPELPHVVAKYETWQHQRHDVKPGVTGLWQVSERGDIPMHEATDIDIEYVETISFRRDVSVILRTIPAAIGSNKGH